MLSLRSCPVLASSPSLFSRLAAGLRGMASPAPPSWAQPTHFSADRWWARPGSAPAVAVVTGGNQGIGLQTCRQLAAQGVTVVLCSRDAARGEAAAKAVAEEWPSSVVRFCQLDLTKCESVDAAASWLASTFPGGVDILVNNAGLAFKGNTFDAPSARQTLATNLDGTAAVTGALLPLLRRKATSSGAGARIVNVCSMAGKRRIVGPALRARFDAAASLEEVQALAREFVTAIERGDDLSALGWPRSMYGVSKLCEATYTRILAAQTADDGLIVSACCPGWCQTNMSSGSGPRTATQGADVLVWLALAPPGHSTGRFWSDRREEDF